MGIEPILARADARSAHFVDDHGLTVVRLDLPPVIVLAREELANAATNQAVRFKRTVSQSSDASEISQD